MARTVAPCTLAKVTIVGRVAALTVDVFLPKGALGQPVVTVRGGLRHKAGGRQLKVARQLGGVPPTGRSVMRVGRQKTTGEVAAARAGLSP